MKKILLIGFVIVLLVGIATAIDLISFSSDSKLTKIYTSTICDKEITMLSSVSLCNKNTPTEIVVDFEKDSKTNLLKINFNGIERSIKK